jgi:hypothetical protein
MLRNALSLSIVKQKARKQCQNATMTSPEPSQKSPTTTSDKVGRMVATLALSAIGLSVVAVIGSIGINAYNNKGFIPPPSTLDRFECADAANPYVFFYLHGTERVKIKSRVGILEGTVRQNRLDWGSFNTDDSMLGFLPPTGISFEDANSLRLGGPGSTQVTCTSTAKHVDQRRAIVQ